MNPIDNLIEETCKSDIFGQSNFDHANKEIASMETTIQALLDVALDLQNLLSSLIVLRVEPALPPEEEKSEIINKSESPAQEIADYMINIGPVNIYSMYGAPGEAFTEFKIQTAEIVGIYAPQDFTRGSQAIMPQLIGITAKEEEEDKSRDALHGLEAQEKKVNAYDKVEPLYTDLKKSALMINELETICESITKISTEKESLPPTDNIILPGQKKVDSGGSEVYKNISGVSSHVKDFSELIENNSNMLYTKILEAEKITDIFNPKNISANSIRNILEISEVTSTAFHTKIREVQKVTDISVLKNEPANAGFTQDGGPGIYSDQNIIDISHYINNISKISERISTAFHSKVREAYEIVEVQAPKNGSPSAGSTKNETHPAIHHDQQMIEIPAFMPDIKVPASSINATKLSNVIAKGSNSEIIAMPFFKETISGTHAISSPLLTLPEPMSNAFEAISNYITVASEMNNQMSKVTEPGGQVASETIASFDLLLKGNDTGSVLTPEFFGGISASDGRVMNIAQSIATTRELQKVGYSVINDITAAAPPGGAAYGGPQAMPRSVDNIMQILSGSHREPASTSHTGSNAVNVHNTFNIMIDAKGGRDENELRDLGKKIGFILSEEIKRYGGIR